mmetsp:Transcript_6469/g.10268  ORF Transcript_6469/g.10268 Transcript_6469/m.10268 type:complete len:214 (-) Transcript_6469:15-656(-)
MGNASPAQEGNLGLHNGCTYNCVSSQCERIDCKDRCAEFAQSRPVPEDRQADGRICDEVYVLKATDSPGLPGLPRDGFDIQPDWLHSYMNSRTDGTDKARLASEDNSLHSARSEIQVDGRSRQPLDVELVREGKYWRTLGLIVSADENPRYLIIEDIWHPSLISEWNASNKLGRQVRVGDIITAINNVEGDSRKMLSTIQGLGKGAQVKLRLE